MKLNLFILIAAILGLIFGLGFLLLPVLTMSLYGVDLSQDLPAQFLARYCGSAFLGLAVIWWTARGAKTQDEVIKGGLLGGLMLGVTGLIVSIWNALAGFVNALVWINPIIYAFLSIGFGYFYFKKSK